MKEQLIQIQITELLNNRFFDISKVNMIMDTLNLTSLWYASQSYKILKLAHCVDYVTLPENFKTEIVKFLNGILKQDAIVEIN